MFKGVLPISIHALLTESDDTVMARGFGGLISIHALLTESDSSSFPVSVPPIVISIHALLTESDRTQGFATMR